MPWKETHVMDERLQFVGCCLEGTWQMAELCRAFGISRNTGSIPSSAGSCEGSPPVGGGSVDRGASETSDVGPAEVAGLADAPGAGGGLAGGEYDW